MLVLTLPENYENVEIPQNTSIQIDIKTAGAFCILSNTATFNPPLPTGYLAIGKYPNPERYPNGAVGTGAGQCNYTFDTSKVNCTPGLAATLGKVIHVGSGKTMEHEEKSK